MEESAVRRRTSFWSLSLRNRRRKLKKMSSQPYNVFTSVLCGSLETSSPLASFLSIKLKTNLARLITQRPRFKPFKSIGIVGFSGLPGQIEQNRQSFAKLFDPSSFLVPLPPSFTKALVRYVVASNDTAKSMFVVDSLSSSSLCLNAGPSFLIFGLTPRSLLLSALNHHGRTVFLDENE
ncbi:hypothetical protein K1719_027931 [Acacia pycnantha]|nr:hypothetical protein K1719_027931 [Acacia pycnantha]